MRTRQTGFGHYRQARAFGKAINPTTGAIVVEKEWSHLTWDYFSIFMDDNSPKQRVVVPGSPSLLKPKACYREQYWLIDSQYLTFNDWNRVECWGRTTVLQQDVRTLFPAISRDVLAAAGRRAWVAMSQDIDGSVSIANFLYELRDIRSLVEHLPNLFRGFSDVAKRLKIGAGSPAELLTQLRKAVSDGHLQWSFGIKPLIGDLEKLQNVTKDLYRRFQWLEDTFGKPTTIRYREELPINITGGVYPIGGWQNDGDTDSHTRLRVGAYKATFRAQALLYHKVRPPAEAKEFFRVYARKLGLDNPAKIVWNALPFSFVLDWFLNTSKLLDTLTEERVLDGVWTLGIPCCSVSEEADFYTDFQGRGFFDPTWRVSGEGRMRRYQRIVGIPLVPIQAELTGASAGQQLLGLSLISSLSKK